MENSNNVIIPFLISIITSFFTGLVASWRYWRQKEADLEAEYLSRFNTKKWEVYTDFTRQVPLIVGKDSDAMKTQANFVSLDCLTPQIVLAGSDEVVTALRAWLETKEIYGQDDSKTNDTLFNLIVEMRRDLGNQYTQLQKSDLLGALKPASG